MSGYWSFEKTKYSRIQFTTKIRDEKRIVYFDDIRNFGTITFCDICEFQNRVDRLGPDVLSSTLTYQEFWSRLGKKRLSKIGAVLLNQNIIAGIGNYLRADILWYCKIDGTTKVKELSEEQKNDLYEGAKNICRYHAYYPYDLRITPKQFGRDFFVYMQETDPYGNLVYTKNLGSRTFHYIDSPSQANDKN